MVKTYLTAALDFFFPPRCHVCRCSIPDHLGIPICPSCRELSVPLVSPLCTRCGIPFIGSGPDHQCGSCSTTPPSFDRARAAFSYDGPCRELIHALKYQGKLHVRRSLVPLADQVLNDDVTAWRPEVLVPVPLHTTRLGVRGFNQAILLGELLARRWQLPLVRNALIRTRPTIPQIELTAELRRDNVRGAFAVYRPEQIVQRRILLIDDVLTTGSTVQECASALNRAGAASVMAITIARALTGQDT